MNPQKSPFNAAAFVELRLVVAAECVCGDNPFEIGPGYGVLIKEDERKGESRGQGPKQSDENSSQKPPP